ncbi:hypothetical protein CRM22_008459 [Opisthorchis felineus]|uniref:C2H2-type domain-containing protein n=1 Tax=Opisthorchis felineus TaxID=147828 RepID=A0A4V3SDG6_OPIFE|nr:hypothetical protein CRM22_008459 [Opisthorchis felineus]
MLSYLSPNIKKEPTYFWKSGRHYMDLARHSPQGCMSYLPCYPLSELHQARNAFVMHWYNAIHRDPWVRVIHDWHYRFPPSIRVLNCAEYPFASEDDVYRMPALPKCGPNDPSASKPRSILHQNARFSQDCKSLTESVLSDPVRQTVSVKSSVGPPIYICDNCSFESEKRPDAEKHLKEAAHSSCSHYASVINQHADSTESDEQSTIVLCQARVIYNASVPGLAWFSEHTAVVCPSCSAIFPDKLMCAYHHQSHHPGHNAKFSYGSVLKFCDFDVILPPTCTNCKQRFSDLNTFVKHWTTGSSTCPSPFSLISLDHAATRPDQIVQVYCHSCRAYFDRLTSTPDGSPHVIPTGTKRKRHAALYDGPSQNNSDSSHSLDPSGLLGFARFCVNHASLHLTGWGGQSDVCKLSIRFVEADKNNAQTLPAYLSDSDQDLLLFCIHECKRMLTYLDHLRTSHRGLHRRAKDELKRLLSLAETYST